MKPQKDLKDYLIAIINKEPLIENTIEVDMYYLCRLFKVNYIRLEKLLDIQRIRLESGVEK